MELSEAEREGVRWLYGQNKKAKGAMGEVPIEQILALPASARNFLSQHKMLLEQMKQTVPVPGPAQPPAQQPKPPAQQPKPPQLPLPPAPLSAEEEAIIDEIERLVGQRPAIVGGRQYDFDNLKKMPDPARAYLKQPIVARLLERKAPHLLQTLEQVTGIPVARPPAQPPAPTQAPKPAKKEKTLAEEKAEFDAKMKKYEALVKKGEKITEADLRTLDEWAQRIEKKEKAQRAAAKAAAAPKPAAPRPEKKVKAVVSGAELDKINAQFEAKMAELEARKAKGKKISEAEIAQVMAQADKIEKMRKARGKFVKRKVR